MLSKRSFRFLLFVAFFISFSQTLANTQTVYPFKSSAFQLRFEKLSTELRCLVCKNQNIAESQAGLAKDLRQKLYEMIKSGETDQAIKSYMTKRYGDFILFKPPLNASTYLLWLTPFISFIVAFLVLYFVLRRKNQKT